MAIGSFMGRVFTVSHTKIFTPSNLKGSTGSDWATHEVVGGKARSEWVGPKLKSYTFDLLLRAQDGVPPRSTLFPAYGGEQRRGLVCGGRGSTFALPVQDHGHKRNMGRRAARRCAGGM